MGTATPAWDPIVTTVRNLCSGNYSRILKIVVWDWSNQMQQRQLLGIFQTTLFQLRQLGRQKFDMLAGTITLNEFSVIEVPTIADYIRGGLKINCSVVIDFTSDNGDKNTPGTLHYLDPTGSFNQYEEALDAIVSILEVYDTDKRIPVYGFGAQTHPDGGVQYNFNINPNNMDCIGTRGPQGVMESYRNCIRHIFLSSPGLMSLSIQKVIDVAKDANAAEQYFILLVLTQGKIEDIARVEEKITDASGLPISIIIVGIGDNGGLDFAEMKRLDADHIKEKIGGNTAPKPGTTDAAVKPTRRDIVQFIKFNQFRSYNTTPGSHQAGSYLAKQVLAEVPNQLVSFMRWKGHQPKGRHFNTGFAPGQPLTQTMFPNNNPYIPNPTIQSFPGSMPPGMGMGMPPNLGMAPSMGMSSQPGIPQSYASMESVYPPQQPHGQGVYPPPTQYGQYPLPTQYGQYPPPTQYGQYPPQSQYGQLPSHPQHGQQHISQFGGAYMNNSVNQGAYPSYPPTPPNSPFPAQLNNTSAPMTNTSNYTSGYPPQPYSR